MDWESASHLYILEVFHQRWVHIKDLLGAMIRVEDTQMLLNDFISSYVIAVES